MKLSKQNIQAIGLYAATLVGVLLGFGASVINTDALEPDAYGNVRYVQNGIQLIATILLFGFFMSGSRLLALSDDEKRSRNIRGTLLVILAVCAALLMSATAIAGLVHQNRPEVSALFLLSVPVCFYPLLTNYMNTTAQGDNHIGRLVLVRILPALIYIPVAKFVYDRFGATSERMVLLQWGLYSILLMIIVLSTKPSFYGVKTIYQELKKENREYGFQLYLGSLAMVATNYLAGVTLGVFNADNTNVGFYTLALTLTQPLSYLPGIVGTAYFKKFVHEPRIPGKVLWVTIGMTVASCVVFMILISPLVNIMYDESYSIVGKYASALALGFSFHGVGDMFNRYLGSHGQGNSIKYSCYISGIFKVLGSVFLVMLWNVNGAIMTVIVSSAIYCLCLYLYYNKYINNSDKV